MASIGAIASADNANKSRKNHTAMGAPTHDIGCHPFAYTDDKIGMQDKAIFVEILTIPSIVCSFFGYAERCIRQATPKENFHLITYKEAGIFRPIASD